MLLSQNIPCESLYNLAKARFLDKRCRFFRAYPFCRPLMLLRPVVKLGPNFKNKYIDDARRTRPVRKSLLIAVPAARAFADTTDHSALLHGFVRGRFKGLHSCDRPAFGNDPPSAPARCDQQNFDGATRSPIRQCRVLRVVHPVHFIMGLADHNRRGGRAVRRPRARKRAACRVRPPPARCRHIH